MEGGNQSEKSSRRARSKTKAQEQNSKYAGYCGEAAGLRPADRDGARSLAIRGTARGRIINKYSSLRCYSDGSRGSGERSTLLPGMAGSPLQLSLEFTDQPKLLLVSPAANQCADVGHVAPEPIPHGAAL